LHGIYVYQKERQLSKEKRCIVIKERPVCSSLLKMLDAASHEKIIKKYPIH